MAKNSRRRKRPGVGCRHPRLSRIDGNRSHAERRGEARRTRKDVHDGGATMRGSALECITREALTRCARARSARRSGARATCLKTLAEIAKKKANEISPV